MKKEELILQSQWMNLRVCPECHEVADDYSTIPGPLGDKGDDRVFYIGHPYVYHREREYDRPHRGAYWEPTDPCPNCGKTSDEKRCIRVSFFKVTITEPRKFLWWKYEEVIGTYTIERFEERTDDKVVPLEMTRSRDLVGSNNFESTKRRLEDERIIEEYGSHANLRRHIDRGSSGDTWA